MTNQEQRNFLRAFLSYKFISLRPWEAKIYEYKIVWPSYDKQFNYINVPIKQVDLHKSSKQEYINIALQQFNIYSHLGNFTTYLGYDKETNIIAWCGDLRDYCENENFWQKQREEKQKNNPEFNRATLKKEISDSKEHNFSTKTITNKVKDLQINNPWEIFK